MALRRNLRAPRAPKPVNIRTSEAGSGVGIGTLDVMVKDVPCTTPNAVKRKSPVIVLEVLAKVLKRQIVQVGAGRMVPPDRKAMGLGLLTSFCTVKVLNWLPGKTENPMNCDWLKEKRKSVIEPEVMKKGLFEGVV